MKEVRDRFKTKKLTVILLMLGYGASLERTANLVGFSRRRIKKINKAARR